MALTRMAGFGGNEFVRGRLQASLFYNRQRNRDRQEVLAQAWVQRDSNDIQAVFAYQRVEDQGFLLGQRYLSVAALMAAVGGTANGSGWTIGPYRDPLAPNIIPDSGVAGWVTSAGAIADLAGELEFTPTAVSLASAHIPVTDPEGVAGKAYELTATLRKTAGTVGTAAGLSTQGNNSAGALSSTVTAATPTAVAVESGFSTVTANNRFFIRAVATPSSGEKYVLGTGRAIRRVDPFRGWPAGAHSVLIKFTTGASLPVGNDQVIWQPCTNDERSRIRLLWRSDGHVRLVVRANVLDQADLDLGVFDVSTQGVIAYSVDQNGFFAASAGDAPVTDTGGVLYGASRIRIGYGTATANPFTGTVDEVQLFAGAQPTDWLQYITSLNDPNVFHAEGDSYTGTTNGINLGQLIATAMGWDGIITANGGATLIDNDPSTPGNNSVLERMLARPYLNGRRLFLWDGSPNPHGDGEHPAGNIDYWKAAIDTIVAMKGGPENCFILAPVSPGGDTSTGTPSQYAIDLRAMQDYLELIGVHTIDIFEFLSSLGNGSPEDNLDIASLRFPRSLLFSGDTVHLSQVALEAVRDEVVPLMLAAWS